MYEVWLMGCFVVGPHGAVGAVGGDVLACRRGPDHLLGGPGGKLSLHGDDDVVMVP